MRIARNAVGAENLVFGSDHGGQAELMLGGTVTELECQPGSVSGNFSCRMGVEWQVRDGLYGKTQRRTSKFMVHDEENAAKIGDTVAITETRPMSRRKRWALARVVRSTAGV